MLSRNRFIRIVRTTEYRRLNSYSASDIDSFGVFKKILCGPRPTLPPKPSGDLEQLKSRPQDCWGSSLRLKVARCARAELTKANPFRRPVMKLLHIFFLTMAVGLLGTQSGVSQSAAQPSPETLQAAKELLAVVSDSMISDLTSKMTAQVWPSMESTLRTRNPKIDAATSGELRKEFERLMVNHVSDTMKDAPAIYARYLTASEMRDIVVFYRTPSGAKTLKVMPQVMADLSATMAPRMQGLQEKVELAFLNLLQKRGLYAQ
jgi:hypothetical protein